MRIVQVAPDIYPLPPTYGGLERIVYDLTEELAGRGHEVYLYAPKGTRTKAILIPYVHPGTWNHLAVAQFVSSTLPHSVDIIHDHTHFSIIGQMQIPIPTVCSIHIATSNPVKYPVYVSRTMWEHIGHHQGFYVTNGLNPKEFAFSSDKQDYLLFLGVLGPHKGIQYALDVAENTNQKLIIAGPVHDLDFYRNHIEPRIKNNALIQYVGKVSGQKKLNLLKNARCVLFPTECPEAFGLVLIEAMICGTPVLAFGHGAVPEVMAGFPQLVCHSTGEMIAKVLNISLPFPQELHEYVLSRFTTSFMTDQYLQVYEKVIEMETGKS